jgi:hypothetical protein
VLPPVPPYALKVCPFAVCFEANLAHRSDFLQIRPNLLRESAPSRLNPMIIIAAILVPDTTNVRSRVQAAGEIVPTFCCRPPV